LSPVDSKCRTGRKKNAVIHRPIRKLVTKEASGLGNWREKYGVIKNTCMNKGGEPGDMTVVPDAQGQSEREKVGRLGKTHNRIKWHEGFWGVISKAPDRQQNLTILTTNGRGPQITFNRFLFS